MEAIMATCNKLLFLRFFMMPVLESVMAGSRKYLADLVFDDKKSDSGFLAESNDQSLPFCSALCGCTCGCFGFNSKHKKCRVYNPCNQTEIAVAEDGWRNYFPEALPKDCHDLQAKGQIEFGVYQVYPFDNTTSINVQCKLETNDAWWTVIQQRRSGNVSFLRTWTEYKNGFGNVEDSYWIGLLKCPSYNQFSFGDETDKYRLFLEGQATGTLGDSMIGRGSINLNGRYFTTKDRDNDLHNLNCAIQFGGGGWWYYGCTFANLNGPWSPPPARWIYPWFPTVRDGREIKEIVMMIKPH